MKILTITFICFLLSVVCFAQDTKQSAMANEDVIDLVKAQFSAELIIKKIQTATYVKFETDTKALKVLKNSGVDEKVIVAMLERSGTNSPSKAETRANETTKETSGDANKVKEEPKKFEKKERDFTFVLDNCKASGDSVRCEFLVTNNDSSIKSLGATSGPERSAIVDDKGNSYKVSRSSVGNIEYGTTQIASGIPMRGSVLFTGLQQQPTSIKWLSLSLHTSGLGRVGGFGGGLGVARMDYFKVEFRDIPLPYTLQAK